MHNSFSLLYSPSDNIHVGLTVWLQIVILCFDTSLFFLVLATQSDRIGPQVYLPNPSNSLSKRCINVTNRPRDNRQTDHAIEKYVGRAIVQDRLA